MVYQCSMYNFVIECNFRKNYKGYLLESRLHFRIHATRLSLSQLVDEDPISDYSCHDTSLGREATVHKPLKQTFSVDSQQASSFEDCVQANGDQSSHL